MSSLAKILGAILLVASMASVSSGADVSVPSDEHPVFANVTTMHVIGVEFAMPSGLAYDASKDLLYVADAGTHAIYAVDAQGNGRVFAGVPSPPKALEDGSYRDGPTSSARFNRPMGLALDRAGDLLVADKDNYCIRRIHAGITSTFAGRCMVSGVRDGTARSSLFQAPLSIAVDPANGDVYVADFKVGIRKIDVKGNVSTVFPEIQRYENRITGLSIAGGILYVTDLSGTVRVPLQEGPAVPSSSEVPDPHMKIDGWMFAGHPYGVFALDGLNAVLVDTRMQNIRLLHAYHSRVIAGSTNIDADLDGGGFNDGPGENARFNAPLAVCKGPSGQLIVADAGNHSLRILGDFDREFNDPPHYEIQDFHFKKNEYRIALIGASFVWSASETPTSIQAAIEEKLAASPDFAAHDLHPHVVSYAFAGAKLGAFVSFIRDILALEHFDTIVVDLSTSSLVGEPVGPVDSAQKNISTWEPSLRKDLKELDTIAKENHLSILVAVNPFPTELVPWETFGHSELFEPVTDLNRSGTVLPKAVAASGIPTLDLRPPMLEEEFRPEHRPLYMTYDGHFSAYGRRFVGNLIAEDLLRRKFWMAAMDHGS
ncbi:MAG TPA: hypothetical protein VGZ00_02540 [Candidatus Baltobacteraceae bacterium]|jgi:hypothetical protein|nr:hypothetical protein [Candidatus Baltobacteraceae bacterium]